MGKDGGNQSGSSNEMTRVFRDGIAKMFIECIKEGAVREDWHRGWGIVFEGPVNGATGTKYKGINRLYLTLILLLLQKKNGWDVVDNRFMTLSQCRKAGYKVIKGSKSVKVEYWFPYDYLNEHPLTWEEFNDLREQMEKNGKNVPEDEKVSVGLKARYYSVFHASQIEGIPEYKTNLELHDIHPDAIVNQIADGMKVQIINDGHNRAFYNPSSDTVHLPPVGSFLSDYDYAATALHELCHSTGHVSRLYRDQTGSFGSEAYAYEELVAEIGSTMMSFHLGTPQNTRDYGNHRAYVQSWINAINSDSKHKVLTDAIKEAEKAVDYMEKFIIPAA